MDLLPKVETDLIEEAPPPLDEEQESDNEDGEIRIQENIVPEVEKKQAIPEEDIFVEKKQPKKELSVEPVKPPKKKRQMTEAQLERLRIGREKGLAKRRAKAAEKKELQELQKKKKKQEIEKLREEVGQVQQTEKPKESKPVPVPAPAAAPQAAPKPVFNSLDDLPKDMLIQLQQAAIEGYDTKRKARKAKKREEQSKQSELNHFQSMVTNAVNPPKPARYGDPGFFSHLW
jgi:hypothetical protein